MFQLLLSRNVLTQLIGITFALLATFHVVLPASVDQASVVAAGLLVMAAVSAVSRFSLVGDGGGDAKAWWQSKTIWTAIVAAIAAVLVLVAALLGFNAGSIDQEALVAAIMVVVGFANIVLHKTSSTAIV